MVTPSHSPTLQPPQPRPGAAGRTTRVQAYPGLGDEQAPEPAYTKRELLTLRVGAFGTGGLGVVSSFAALWGMALGYPVLSHAGIAGLVAVFCIGAAASIALWVSGAWPPSSE